MIASLPMYDWPEIRAETNRFWALIRDHLRRAGIDAPDHLDREKDLRQSWLSPDLLLSQTCGLPYRSELHEQVSLVGTLDHGLTDAPAGYYYSAIITRRDEALPLAAYASKRFACNGLESQSGFAAPQNHAQRSGFSFTDVCISGAHGESARAVAEGRADIAAIDAVTWRLIQSHLPELAAQLRVIERTLPTPGLPLITAQDPAPITAAVRAALADLPTEDREALGLRGLALIPKSAYLAIPTPASPTQIGTCD